MRITHKKIRSLCLLLAVLLPACLFSMPAHGEEAGFPSTSEASAVYFYHLESHRVIGARNETQRLPAGSTVKILSGLLFCEYLGSQLAETVTVTADMLEGAAGFRYPIAAGDLYSVEDLLYMAICGSYNDAYTVLAHLVGMGSIREFTVMMNDRASRIGTKDSLFTDPVGLLDTSFTTAEDLFLISRTAIQNDLYLKLCSAQSYFLPKRRVYNANALISTARESSYRNPDCKGLSAGSTTLGGYSLSALAHRENDSYLCIVLGAPKSQDGQIFSYVIANRLFEWAYTNYTYLEILSPETVVCTIPVTISDLCESLDVKANESLFAHLPANAKVGEDVTYSIRLTHKSLEAPVTEGTPVGYVAVVYKGDILGTAPLYVAGSATRSSFVSRLNQIQLLTENRGVRAGLVFFVVALTVWFAAEYILKVRRRHKWDKYFSEKVDMAETVISRSDQKNSAKRNKRS